MAYFLRVTKKLADPVFRPVLPKHTTFDYCEVVTIDEAAVSRRGVSLCPTNLLNVSIGHRTDLTPAACGIP